MPSLSELINELHNSSSMKNIRTHKLFLNSYEIYFENYQELVKEITKHEKLKISELLKSTRGKRQLWKKQFKIVRFLHNYLASSFTLIQITRNFYRTVFQPNNKLIDYNLKIENEIVIKPITHFIKDFRNFIQHYRLPHINTTTSFKINSDFETFVHFKSEDLNQFDRWTSKSKEYLKEHPKGIRLKDVILEYHGLISKFNLWFINHAEKELENDYTLIKRYEKLIKIERFREYLKVMQFLEKNIDPSQFEKSISLFITKNEKKKIDNQSLREIRVDLILAVLHRHGVDNESQIEWIRKIYSL